MNLDAGRHRVTPFAADCLAFACGKDREKIVEAAVTCIAPMELLIGPLQKSLRAEQLPLRARGEGDVGRGRGVQPTELDESRRERPLALFRASTRHDEKA